MARRPSFRAFSANWRSSDLPFLDKLAKTVKNNAKKAVTLSQCCGNHGEPGC